jgi:DNA-binding GntR family transcriptional regulator
MNAEERAYGEVMEMILSRKYAPGDRLVEAELAKEMGLSRTPVRNALRKLVAEGLLENRNQKGCYIPRLTPQDMQETFQARIFLEGKAAMEAARFRNDGEAAMLLAILKREKEYYRNGRVKDYTQANKEFHLSIAAMARNAYIEKFVHQTFWRSELYIFFFDRFYRPELSDEILRDPNKSVSCREHDKIARAIEAGDPSAAEVSMKAHLLSTLNYLAPRYPTYSFNTGLQNR